MSHDFNDVGCKFMYHRIDLCDRYVNFSSFYLSKPSQTCLLFEFILYPARICYLCRDISTKLFLIPSRDVMIYHHHSSEFDNMSISFFSVQHHISSMVKSTTTSIIKSVKYLFDFHFFLVVQYSRDLCHTNSIDSFSLFDLI